MSQTEVLNNVYKLIDYIKSTNEYKRLNELNDKINIELKDLIKDFKDVEDKYNEALRYGKYHPNLKDYQIALSQAKEKLFTNPMVIEFKELESSFNNTLNEIFNDVKISVSNKFELTKIMR